VSIYGRRWCTTACNGVGACCELAGLDNLIMRVGGLGGLLEHRRSQMVHDSMLQGGGLKRACGAWRPNHEGGRVGRAA
jgi:hypothetical protein